MSSSSDRFSNSEKKWQQDSDAQTLDSPLSPLPRSSSEISVEVATDLIAVVSRTSQPQLSKKVTSVGTTGTTDPDFEVDWEENDPENPRNWPLWYKSVVLGFLSFNTWVV
jgi:hypothetical protein